MHPFSLSCVDHSVQLAHTRAPLLNFPTTQFKHLLVEFLVVGGGRGDVLENGVVVLCLLPLKQLRECVIQLTTSFSFLQEQLYPVSQMSASSDLATSWV